ncbi:MAG: hypothetical protein ACLFN8_01795 [Candidatus Woesearchaeota archaeon]
MVELLLALLLIFVISWVVSAVIIFFATGFFGRRKSFWTAMVAALIGSIIYVGANLLFGGFLASFIGGVAWLIALSSLYRVGFFRSLFIAFFIWVLSAIASWFLPTLL